MKKTCLLAAAGLVATSTVGLITTAQASTLTVQEKITLFNPDDFAYSLGGPELDGESRNGARSRPATLGQLPALEGQGIAMVIINLEPCSINQPHVHPRASEMAYVISGSMRSAFVEENGGEGNVVNDLLQGDVMFYPQGLIHYQQNLGCEPVSFVTALNSEDPGIVSIMTQFFQLPSEALQASLNLEDPALQALIDSLPESPALARRQCLQACGLLDGDGSYNFGYDN